MRVTRSTLTIAALCLAPFAGLFAVAVAGTPISDGRPLADQVKRGEYLVTIAACHDCHSPKVDAQLTVDAARPLSGRPGTTWPPMQADAEVRASLDLTAWAGPWGNSYAANLTPDPETGIGGRYTAAAFVNTIRTGKKPEGEPLLPPMPWTVYRNMTDEDLKAVYAYLTTLKPVRNFVRAAPTAVATQ
jgi:cytochrome c553